MVYQCSICGYVYDEEQKGKPFSELTECPVCKQPRRNSNRRQQRRTHLFQVNPKDKRSL